MPEKNAQQSMSQEDIFRESYHRYNNDLQLIVSLLAVQSRQAANPEVRWALEDAMERITVFAHSRRTVQDTTPRSLNSALRQVCEALHTLAEPRSILVAFRGGDHVESLSQNSVTKLVLVVNELATNAIKHGFKEGNEGNIWVTTRSIDGMVVVSVNDDGLPFLIPRIYGTGLELAKRFMLSINGELILPDVNSKSFELRAPFTL